MSTFTTYASYKKEDDDPMHLRTHLIQMPESESESESEGESEEDEERTHEDHKCADSACDLAKLCVDEIEDEMRTYYHCMTQPLLLIAFINLLLMVLYATVPLCQQLERVTDMERILAFNQEREYELLQKIIALQEDQGQKWEQEQEREPEREQEREQEQEEDVIATLEHFELSKVPFNVIDTVEGYVTNTGLFFEACIEDSINTQMQLNIPAEEREGLNKVYEEADLLLDSVLNELFRFSKHTGERTEEGMLPADLCDSLQHMWVHQWDLDLDNNASGECVVLRDRFMDSMDSLDEFLQGNCEGGAFPTIQPELELELEPELEAKAETEFESVVGLREPMNPDALPAPLVNREVVGMNAQIRESAHILRDRIGLLHSIINMLFLWTCLYGIAVGFFCFIGTFYASGMAIGVLCSMCSKGGSVDVEAKREGEV